MALLEVRDLAVSYGKIAAVKGISFDVEQGQIVCLIGTNGAGKTTTMRAVVARTTAVKRLSTRPAASFAIVLAVAGAMTTRSALCAMAMWSTFSVLSKIPVVTG